MNWKDTRKWRTMVRIKVRRDRVEFLNSIEKAAQLRLSRKWRMIRASIGQIADTALNPTDLYALQKSTGAEMESRDLLLKLVQVTGREEFVCAMRGEPNSDLTRLREEYEAQDSRRRKVYVEVTNERLLAGKGLDLSATEESPRYLAEKSKTEVKASELAAAETRANTLRQVAGTLKSRLEYEGFTPMEDWGYYWDMNYGT